MRKEFGLKVREKRIQQKLTQEKLSYLADVNRTFVGMIERGEKNITIGSMEKIANGLDVNLKISLVEKK